MLKGTWRTDKAVIGIGGSALDAHAFETSVYAQFWQEASRAVALSRRGKVHLIASVSLETLKALHRESRGGVSPGRMAIAVVCQDHESLAGPMLRGIERAAQGWRMGDGVLVQFFDRLPGPDAGELSQPLQVQVSQETQGMMDALSAAMARLARKVAAEKRP